jgi:hypothetical protein
VRPSVIAVISAGTYKEPSSLRARLRTRGALPRHIEHAVRSADRLQTDDACSVTDQMCRRQAGVLATLPPPFFAAADVGACGIEGP